MTRKIGGSMRILFVVQLHICLAFVFIPGITFADLRFEIVDTISQPGNSIEDISFSPANTMYGIDSCRNKILIYGADDQIHGNIFIEQPTAIAALDSILYVGSSSDLSVAMFDLTGKIVGYLGRGAREFKLPRNIAIDYDTNDIYVVDQLDDSIKVYSNDGALLRRIDDSPNLPQDVTIVDGEIFVLDQPLITDVYGDQIRGSRVSVFDMTGTLVRSFGAYGANDGELVRPKAITSDAQGVIYIADAFNGVVLCFDQEGKFQQKIYNPKSSMIGSMGLAIDQTGRLLVSTPLTGRLNVFLIDSTMMNTPKMSISPPGPNCSATRFVPTSHVSLLTPPLLPATQDHQRAVRPDGKGPALLRPSAAIGKQFCFNIQPILLT